MTKAHVFSKKIQKDVEEAFSLVSASMQSASSLATEEETQGFGMPSTTGLVVSGSLLTTGIISEAGSRYASKKAEFKAQNASNKAASEYSRAVRSTQDLHKGLDPKVKKLDDLLNGESIDDLKSLKQQAERRASAAKARFQQVVDDLVPREVQHSLAQAESQVTNATQGLDSLKKAGFQDGCYEVGKGCSSEELAKYRERLGSRCAQTGEVVKVLDGKPYRFNKISKKWDIPVKKTLLDVSHEFKGPKGKGSIIELPKTEAAKLFVAEEVAESGKPLKNIRKADSNSAQKVVEKCSRPATGENASRTLVEAQNKINQATQNAKVIQKSVGAYKNTPEYIEAKSTLNRTQSQVRLIEKQIVEAEKLTQEIATIKTKPANAILLENELKTGRTYGAAKSTADRARVALESGKAVGKTGTALRVGGRLLMGVAVASFVADCVRYINYEKSFAISNVSEEVDVDGRLLTSTQMAAASKTLFDGDENKIAMFMGLYAVKHGLGNISKDQWAHYVNNMGSGKSFSMNSEVKLRQALLRAYKDLSDEEKVTFLDELYQENKENPNQEIPLMLKALRDSISLPVQVEAPVTEKDPILLDEKPVQDQKQPDGAVSNSTVQDKLSEPEDVLVPIVTPAQVLSEKKEPEKTSSSKEVVETTVAGVKKTNTQGVLSEDISSDGSVLEPVLSPTNTFNPVAPVETKLNPTSKEGDSQKKDETTSLEDDAPAIPEPKKSRRRGSGKGISSNQNVSKKLHAVSQSVALGQELEIGLTKQRDLMS